MIFTINKSHNPYNGLNIHMRSLSRTGLTQHKIGFSYNDQDLRHADMLIFGNYLPEDLYSLSTNLHNQKIGYMFCSPFGQASCNGELGLLKQLMDMLDDPHARLDYLFCTDSDMVATLNHKRVVWLPVVSDFEGVYVIPPKREGITFIGNNLRTSRNFANQLAALKIMQKLGKMNEPIVSYMEDSAYKFFKSLFQLDNWTNNEGQFTEEDKKKIVASSKLGMQVTYSDSFNIAAYEYAMCHVPCMVSESLPWGSGRHKVKRIDNPAYMALDIQMVLSNLVECGEAFHEQARVEMKHHVDVCSTHLKECL